MSLVPAPEELRQRLRALDELDKKVVGGLVALLMAAPHRVRDREWLAERFMLVATVAHGFAGEGDAATDDDVERVRLYARMRFLPLADAALLLFVRAAEDLRAAGGAPDLARAQAIVRSYFA